MSLIVHGTSFQMQGSACTYVIAFKNSAGKAAMSQQVFDIIFAHKKPNY